VFARVKAWLKGSSRDHARSLRVKLEREQALQRVRDAEARGDDRDLGRALMVAKEATLNALRAGV
jgi:hypothetical protein